MVLCFTEQLSYVVVLDCLASLRVVKFGQVNGDDHVIFLAKFFMENWYDLGEDVFLPC
jgi:hypothetical protein